MDKKSRPNKFMMDPEGVIWYDPDGKIIGDGSLQAFLNWKEKHGKTQDKDEQGDNSPWLKPGASTEFHPRIVVPIQV